jgi:hypothetical protein
MGSTRNFEKAISICRGDVIVLTDQDDSWCVNRLQVTEIVLKQRPDVGAVFADAYIVDKDLKPLGYNLWKAVQFNRRLKCQVEEGNAFEALLAHNFVTGATMAFRAEFRALIIPIPALWVHDGWIAIIISAFANVACIDQPLIQYRQHSCQQLGARRQSMVARIASTQALDNRVNYRQMPEQFRCVFERLKETAGYEVPQRLKDLLQEKIRHMSQRAILPKSHLRRLSPIAGELVSNRYRRFGYGWKGVLRDLLVNLDG